MEASDEEIGSDSEYVFGYKIYSSHNSDSEFKAVTKTCEFNQKSDIYKDKNKIISEKDKLNQKVKNSACNATTHLPGLTFVASNITVTVESWELLIESNVIKI